MKTFIRIGLVLAVLVAFVLNYQIYSFGYGFVNYESNTNSAVMKEVSFYVSVEEVAYYDMMGISSVVVFKSKTHTSRIYRVTKEGQEAIVAFASAASVLGGMSVKQVTVLPWFIYIILLLVAMFVPLGSKKC